MRSVSPRATAKLAGVVAALVAVVADAETEVEPVGLVAELDEQVPDRQRVLAAADGDEHPLARHEHVVVGDRLLDLAAAQLLQVLAAEVGVVAGQVDDRRPPAHAAFAHIPPPADRSVRKRGTARWRRRR